MNNRSNLISIFFVIVNVTLLTFLFFLPYSFFKKRRKIKQKEYKKRNTKNKKLWLKIKDLVLD